MSTLADSLVSSATRPLRLRMRPDLQSKRQRYHGQSFWVVKEPVGLNYYRFHEEEYAILCMLNGQASLESIKEQFEREFTPQRITFQDLQQFIGMLHRSGLVISEASGQGRQLKKRRDDKKRREFLGKLSNVFALRWRGFDPEWILNKLYPYTGWFFRPAAVTFFLLLGLSALLLVAVQFDVFRSRLPAFNEFFGSWDNWLVMAIAMGIAKVLHEFGHGLSCKHFKGECHEIGFMMLVFTPALYCNVSDSWMLPNKWHRAFIGAAGMYVEVVLATLATFIWWITEPTTMLNQVCLSLMFVCSVSTVLFNGNPLLRFDGYYILMDLAEIPNLRQKATEVLKRFMVELCLGIEQPENPFLPQSNRFVFGLYTLASVVYRWIVVFSILMFLNKVLEPYGLKAIGRIIAGIGFFGLIVQPIFKLVKFFYVPGRMHKVKRHRLLATIGVVAAALAFVIYVPLPFHVDCSFQVKPRDAEAVYASVSGRLVDVRVKPGHPVKAQDVLARMDNLDLKLAILELEGQLELVEEQIRLAERPRPNREQASRLELRVLQKARATYQRQLEEKKKEFERLTIVAPSDGVVLPPADRRPQVSEGQLPDWSGTVFDPKNKDATLVPSDEICMLVDPSKGNVAELVIDQSFIDYVKNGDRVDLMLDSYPGYVIPTEIEELARAPLHDTPMNLASQAGGTVDSVTDSSGRLKPLSTTFPARAALETDSDRLFQIGMRGRAKIYTGWLPLGTRLYRFAARTFHFEL